MRCLAVMLLLLAQPVWAGPCRQALVLALDVSGSVNAQEYQQQVNGLADALDSPEVRHLILFGADAPVALAVFEWSSRNHQLMIQPWVMLNSPGALDAAIARIRQHRKQRAGLKTALGTALMHAAALLRQQPDCWRKTIDVSGDGPNNIGATPAQTYDTTDFGGATVNALVIGSTDRDFGLSDHDLQRYFEQEVLMGPGAFSIIAHGYADYARAMQLKLERELQLPIFGSLSADHEKQP